MRRKRSKRVERDPVYPSSPSLVHSNLCRTRLRSMPGAPSSSSSAPLLGASRGRVVNEAARTRQAELAAAFGGSDDEEDEVESEFGRRIDGDIMARARLSSLPSSSSPPRYTTSPSTQQRSLRVNNDEDDVFFDAGDAIAQHHAGGDPLGAQRVNVEHQDDAGASRSSQQTIRQQSIGVSENGREHSYDFERASYFAPPRRPPVSRSASMALNASTHHEAGDHDTTIDMSGVAQDPTLSSVSRVRQALGRFGRLVGMRVPGATYSSLNGEDDHANAVIRRRVMGSGIGQDGVFANLNAKPERRRRRSGEDRGEDDDLVDDVLPPSYEIAAADAAPPYWETTIIGGPGGFHPLAPGGAGWTPGGAHVGALEDLIVEGLPIGNFFGFAWNLLVSMSFQFIGFLLTYLLHTTHAARCGSRAGLGITLVQYGFYLRTRAAQMAEGKLPEDIIGVPTPEPTPTGDQPHVAIGAWWSDGNRPQATPSAADEVHKLLARGITFVFSRASESGITSSATSNGTLADALSNDDGTIRLPSAESMSASTEWLAYILMGMGWFILLTSLLSYWRVHRWAKQLVDAAHRENESSTPDAANTQENGERAAESDPNAPVGFLYTFRNALRNNNARRSRRREQTRAHSAEDWIIFPGRPRRDLFGSSRDRSGGREASGDENAEHVIDVESANMSVEERRLLEDMRHVGLIN